MMKIKGIIDEDTVNYKKICMTIEFPKCSFKCDKECGQSVCQNGALTNSPDISINIDRLVERYVNNPITEAIVYQGLEPLDTWEDVLELTDAFRQQTDDDIVIYTGYTKCEIRDKVEELKKYKNIVIKYGRYVPNEKTHYDKVLGVDLASDNQYAEKIS